MKIADILAIAEAEILASIQKVESETGLHIARVDTDFMTRVGGETHTIAVRLQVQR